jgi:hypothetical protein
VIAALDEPERERVLARVAALVADVPQPLQLGYSCQIHVYERAESTTGAG